MNRFRVNLHQNFLQKGIDDGSDVERKEKDPIKKDTKELSGEVTQLPALNLTDYLIKRDNIEFKNKDFADMYNDLLVKQNWGNGTIEIGPGVDVMTMMDYVLALFFYYQEEGKTELGEQEIKELKGNNAETMKNFYQLFLKNQSEVESLHNQEVDENNREKTHKKEDTRRSNESLASSTKPIDLKKEEKEKKKQQKQQEKMSKMKTDEERNKEQEKQLKKQRKELEKQLNQLAKNKKIDFPWTNNEWKCSGLEAELGESSAKVFQQLLDHGSLKYMIDFCRSTTGELTKEQAKVRKIILGINSKEKDIQNFYKSYKEYQHPQLGFQHLINLMDFFCASGFESLDDVRQALKEQQSLKISKKDIKKYPKEFTQGDWHRKDNGDWEYTGSDKRKGKPEDWKQRVSFEIIKDRLGEDTSTDKMLTLLGDFNLDGEVNSGDVGYKTGTQLVEVFRRIVATEKLEHKDFSDDEAVKNLVAYANKFGKKIEGVNTVSDLYTWMTKSPTGYDNTRKLQNFIRDLPIELGDVLRNGANAGTDSLESIASVYKLEAQEREKAMAAATQKAQDFVNQNQSLLNERAKDAEQRANITQQLLSQLPGVLMQQAQAQGKGLSVGAAIPLDEVIKGFSLGFKLGVSEDGDVSLGIYGAYDHKFNLGKGSSLSTGGSVGVNTFFIPCGSLFVELGYDVNEEKRKQTLKATGIEEVKLGANCTMYGPVFSRGVSAGYEKNKQGGIEKQARNINGQLKSIALDLVDVVTNNPEEKRYDAIYDKLNDMWPKASKEELGRATTNILQITSQFKIDEKTDQKDKDIYAQIIADVYTDIWRNESLSGIADNKTKLSGGKVGVQFLAGFLPTPSLVLKFTKYYNARTDETEHSKAARVDAQVNGTGNREVPLDSKEIGEAHIEQINKILERYGAKTFLRYIAGEDGKPGRVEVPSSIADGIGINVRVSKSLDKCIKHNEEKFNGDIFYYWFPANATYRILQETGGNQRSVTLNIGSDKSSDDDISISDFEGMENLFGEKELMGNKKLEYKADYENKGTVEYKPEFLNMLSDLGNGLRDIDSANRRTFREFMRTKRDAVEEFQKIVEALKNVLSNKKFGGKYDDLVKWFDNNEFSDGDRQVMIDKIMAISAYYEPAHKKETLNKAIQQRREVYKKLRGPNGQTIFDKFDGKNYRSDIVNELNDNYDSVYAPNILGATAFYNRNAQDARGLGITGLGSTAVLGGVTKELIGNDAEKAKEWFLGGGEGEDHTTGVLDKSPKERENLKKGVSNYINSQIGAFTTQAGTNILEEASLKSLLNGEEIDIQLDNSQKKVKVKLDVKYVFYLMGECANESVGMELGDLNVKEQEEVADYTSGQLFINNGDRSNSVSIQRSDHAYAVSLNLGKKGEKGGEGEPEDNPWSDPNTGKVKGGDDNNGKPGTIPTHEGGPIGKKGDDPGSKPNNAGGGNPDDPGSGGGGGLD